MPKKGTQPRCECGHAIQSHKDDWDGYKWECKVKGCKCREFKYSPEKTYGEITVKKI